MIPLPAYPTAMGPSEVAAAIFCGANTPERLAREWGITEGLARSLIQGALDAELVIMSRHGFTASAPGELPPVADAREGREVMARILRKQNGPRSKAPRRKRSAA